MGTLLDTDVRGVSEPPTSPSLISQPGPAPSQISGGGAQLEGQRVEETAEVEEKKRDVHEKPQKKPFWLEDELPPVM